MTHDLDVGPQAGLERAHARAARTRRRRRAAASRPARAAFRPDRRTERHLVGLATRHGLAWAPMASRETEPWTRPARRGARRRAPRPRGLRGRPRRPQLVDAARRAAPDAAGRRCGHAGIDALYSHQAEALQAALDGPTIVTTGTASGKSLCFQLPTLEMLCSRRHARGRSTSIRRRRWPRTRRARCTRSGLHQQLRPAIYDGDTPREERAAIRKRSNLILTNPDMLHVGILPHHRAWGDLFANLAFVVVDEAHVYRGVFGSHVANVLRRLRRLAAAYGTAPRFLLASATIANPVELAERLTGLDDFALIDRDGSPRRPARRSRCGTRRCWTRRSQHAALGAGRGGRAARPSWSRDGARTICFMKSRKGVELVAQLVASALDGAAGARARRARRALPRRLHAPAAARDRAPADRAASCSAVVATDALELGIDIGALDAAICVTFPGTVASLRQMWGRAGRRGRGLAVYVAGEDALDQFFCRHPDEFLERPVEAAILDHEHEQIHLAAPALRRPRGAARPRPTPSSSGRAWRAYAEALVARASCVERAAARSSCARPRTSRRRASSLRSASADSVRRRRRSSGEVLGHGRGARARSRPSTRARSTCTMGRSYEVARARPRWPPRARRAVRRRLVHAAQARDRDRHRAPARPPRGARRDAVLRRRSRSPSRCSATSASGSHDHEVIDFDRARPAGRRRSRRRRSGTSSTADVAADDFPLERCSARCTRPSTRRSRCCR